MPRVSFFSPRYLFTLLHFPYFCPQLAYPTIPFTSLSLSSSSSFDMIHDLSTTTSFPEYDDVGYTLDEAYQDVSKSQLAGQDSHQC